MNILKSKLFILILVTTLLLAVLAAVFIVVFPGSDYYKHKKTTYRQPPVFLGSIGAELKPISLSFYQNRLYVSYLNSNRIDVFTPRGELRKSITLPQGVQPRTISVGKEKIFVADKTGEIKTFSNKGKLINSYGLLPENHQAIRATSAHLHGDRLYVADANLPGILVISAVTVYGPTEKGSLVLLTEEGELILTIPEKEFRPRRVTEHWDLMNPSYAIVSPDGRVLVSDTDLGMVKAYTCTGWYAYPFERGKGKETVVRPVAIDYDDLSNPKYEKEKRSVDPSGIRSHGRVHVVDRARNRVFVYTTTGNFLFTYGQGRLSSPRSIAIDTKHRLIFIADTGNRRIAVWGY